MCDSGKGGRGEDGEGRTEDKEDFLRALCAQLKAHGLLSLAIPSRCCFREELV